METQTELLVPEKPAVPEIQSGSIQPAPITPMHLLQMAVAQDFDEGKLKALMAFKKEWEADEARKAFIEAMSLFKAHAITVVKDKTNTQYSSKYVTLGNLVHTVTPFLSRHGLSVRWDHDQSNAPSIKVSCVITHMLGHSESVSMTVPPDTSGKKNPIQEIKSSITYAKACTFESICGLASTDANVDDDGNGSGLTNDWLADQVSEIGRCETPEGLREAFLKASTIALEEKDINAYTVLKEAKDKRKAAL